MILSLPSIMHGSIKQTCKYFRFFFTTCGDLSMSKVGQMSDDQHFNQNPKILFAGPFKVVQKINHSELPTQIRERS